MVSAEITFSRTSGMSTLQNVRRTSVNLAGVLTCLKGRSPGCRIILGPVPQPPACAVLLYSKGQTSFYTAYTTKL